MPKILPIGAVVAGVAVATAISGCGAASGPAAHTTAAVGQSASLAASVTSARAAKATLHTAKVRVGSKREMIAVTAADRPVYLLTGDSSHHPLCASSECLGVWPAVSSAHPTAVGLRGKLAVWRHDGLSQVTLNGHPLYTYAGDSGSSTASGEGVTSFGGTWLVLSAAGTELNTSPSSGDAAQTSGTGTSGGGW